MISRLKREAELLDLFLERMGKGEPVAYGRAEVEEAASAGAVEQVLVIDDMVRNRDIADLLERVERTRSKVTVFSSLFDPGPAPGHWRDRGDTEIPDAMK